MGRWLGKILARQTGGTPPAGWYASTTGSAGGDGSIGDPWDLQTALDGGPTTAEVQPGDTIWVRGGTYTDHFASTLTGTSGSPIIVRNYNKERAILDQAGYRAGSGVVFQNLGDYTRYWGLEFTDSGKNMDNAVIHGMTDCPQGNTVKYINCIFHDGRIALGLSTGALDAEVYGCLFYYNGILSTEHHVYPQNNTGTKHLLDNILIDASGFGFHLFTVSSYERNWEFRGNLVVRSGALVGTRHANYLIQSVGATSILGISMLNNYSYDADGVVGVQVQIGAAVTSIDATVNNNYFVGGQPFSIDSFNTVQFRNNTIIPREGNNAFVIASMDNGGNDPNTWDWDANTYVSTVHNADLDRWNYKGTLYTFTNWKTATGLDAASTATQSSGGSTPPDHVAVFPNSYETGRGHVYVYNWSLAGSVSVDMSTIIPNGWTYTIKNAHDYFGTPVASGTYAGGNLSITMTGLTVATAEAFTGLVQPTTTGPEFGAFIIESEAP